MGKAQKLFLEVVQQALKVEPQRFTANWFINKPRKEHFRVRYDAAMAVFDALGGNGDGLDSKGTRKLNPDAYLPPPYNCLIEYDEVQHFTRFKQKALELYPATYTYGFSVGEWLDRCKRHRVAAEAKGQPGYRKPTEDFPFPGGRHSQRAFLDMFRDFLPPLWGLRPTVRVSEFEFRPGSDNPIELKRLIESRLR